MPLAHGVPAKRELVAAFIALVVLGATAVAFYSRFSLNHDSSWYLIATDRLLDGAQLYSDIMEINPPLAFYLTVPPVAAARFLGADPTIAFFIYCTSLGVASSLWALVILRKSGLSHSRRLGFFCAVVAALFVLPMPEFGQREHLLLLFAMPFLVAQIVLKEEMRLTSLHQILLGLVASLGFLLKPYFLIIPAAIGLVRLWRQRNLTIFGDPGYLAIGAAAVMYLIFISQAHPAYLDVIVPMAAEVYTSFGRQAKDVILRAEFFALALTVLAIWRSPTGWDRRLQGFAAACFASALVFLLQFKGWNYQLLPLSAFVFLTAAWLLLRDWRGLRRDALYTTSLLVAATLTLGIQIARGPYESATSASFGRFVSDEGQSILVLSTNVSAAFPFVNEVSGQWANGYPAQWLIPGAYTQSKRGSCHADGNTCAGPEKILGFARQSIVDDLERFRPDIIYVDERANKAYFADHDFDYFGFLAEDPRFENLRRCYERIGKAGGYGVYRKNCQRVRAGTFRSPSKL